MMSDVSAQDDVIMRCKVVLRQASHVMSSCTALKSINVA